MFKSKSGRLWGAYWKGDWAAVNRMVEKGYCSGIAEAGTMLLHASKANQPETVATILKEVREGSLQKFSKEDMSWQINLQLAMTASCEGGFAAVWQLLEDYTATLPAAIQPQIRRKSLSNPKVTARPLRRHARRRPSGRRGPG